MNSAKQWRRTNRFSSSLIGNGRDHRMQKNKMPVPTEAQEQMTLFSWAAMQSGKYPELNLLYHVPNGGSRHKAEAGRLRAEGVKAGVPDLCLPVARGQYHGLYIELKRQRGGRTSDHQSEWPVSYTHLRAHETRHDLVCRLLLEKKKKKNKSTKNLNR